jgi:DNA repair protein RecO (recombination protein O)
VSRAAGLPYRDKLLPLPGFLWRQEPADRQHIALGMALTGHFLMHHVFAPQGRTLPAARIRLAERIRQAPATVTMRD